MGASYYQEEDFGAAENTGKELLKNLLCPTHKKKARVSFDYDEFGNNAYIEKCCCPDFVKQVSDSLAETKRFNKIEVTNSALK